MKRIIFSLVFLVAGLSASGQKIDPEALMTRKMLSCQDIYYNATYLIPEYYNKGSFDTLHSVLDFWQSNCMMTEDLMRCKILISIADGSFSEDMYGENIIGYLESYLKSKNLLKSYSNVPSMNIYNRLDGFTSKLAQNLFLREDLTPVERFFVEFYSDMFGYTLDKLKSEKYSGTKLRQYYMDKNTKGPEAFLGHGSIIFGTWIPTDSLQKLGVHPVFGFSGGFRYKRFFMDATLSLKVGKSPNVYKVEKNDSIYNTDHFLGGYLGLDFGYTLFSSKNSSVDLIGGVGFDGFDALEIKGNNSYNDITVSINTLNLNAGIGLKRNISQGSYIGLDVKYNFVDYRNRNGTNLNGNTITVCLIYGFFRKPYNYNYYRFGRYY